MPNPNAEHALFSLVSKLCWSKNIYEERDAPHQVLFGAAHIYYCCIVGLASWLEWWLSTDDYKHTQFMFGIDGLNDADCIKRRASTALKEILGEDHTFDEVIEVMADDTRKLGTHSMRKYAATMAGNCGIHSDDIDLRYASPFAFYFF